MRSLIKNLLITVIFALTSGLIVKYQPGATIGLIFLLFFSVYYSNPAYLLLVRLFDFPKSSFLRRFFGVLTVFWLFTTSCGLLILFGLPLLYLAVLVIPLTVLFLGLFTVLTLRHQKNNENLSEVAELQEFVLPSSTSLIGALFILMLGGFYVLFKNHTGLEISTPWTVLPNFYIYLYLLIFAVLGLLIFTNNHAKTILILFFVFSLLTHFNLALSHDLVYGADYWRHLGTQNQILQNGGVMIQNFSENPNWFEKINFGLYSYAGFWGLNVILNLFTGVDLLNLGKFVGPILWSLFIPVLFYALGRVLHLPKRLALFLTWLSFIPSALLISGSFSLPVSLGFIFWLFSLLLLLKADLQKNKTQFFGLVVVGLLLSLGYLLYAILFFLALLLKLINVYLKENNWQSKISWLVVFVFTALFLPVIEVIAGYSQMSIKSGFFPALKQFIGNLTGYYFVSGPRPHTISTGNILFYQTPLNSFVENYLTIWPWWMLPISLLFIGLSIYGAYKFFSKEIDRRWLVVLFAGLFIGYFISRYLLNGENILTRRLDTVLATGLIIFFCLAVSYLGDYLLQRKFILLGIICLSIFGASIYSLGPVSKIISTAEYNDYLNIAEQTKDETKFCVIADPYNLTALEGISAKRIIGGGFPIKGDFSQTQLENILEDWQAGLKDKEEIIKEAKVITGAKNCFVVIKDNKNVMMMKY